MSAPQYCHRCGAPLRPGIKFCGQCGQVVLPPPAAPQPGTPVQSEPQQLVYPFQQPAYPLQQQAYLPPQQAYPPAYAPPRRPKRRSGLGCWLTLLVLFVLLLACVGGGLTWALTASRRTLSLASRTKLLTQTVAVSGGEIRVSNPNGEIDGLSIDVPPDAYPKETRFTISTRPIKTHRFGDLFDPITPLITIDNGHGLAAEPMRVEIPIRLGPDEFAMAFFWDPRTGKLEGIPLIGLTADKITLVTSHFTELVVSRVKVDKLGKVTVETGFAPGVDDWQFTNYGSIIAPGGHCAGQSISMMWYYYEKRLGAGERPLYGRYDNNNYGFGTIDFYEDDSWDYRLASTVQLAVDWDAKSRILFNALGWASDSLTWHAFAYSMALTGEPQYMAIGRYEKDAEGNDVRRGHAIVAYRIDGNSIYVADPNYPGQANRTIRYENDAFLPYASGDNANDIAANGAKAYTEIRYMAKSALVDWDQIGVEYAKMLKGEVGKDRFPSYILSVLRYDSKARQIEWQIDPVLIEIDEAETALPGEDYRGKLRFGVGMPAGSKYGVAVYDGTKLVETKLAGADGKVTLDVPLKPGINDLGFHIVSIKEETINGQQVKKYYDNDFRRVKVIYELPDLSGVWEGAYRVQDAGKVLQYVEDILTQFVLALGLTDSEAKAREAAAGAITVDPNLYNDRPIRIALEAVDPDKLDRYRATVQTVADDGTLSEMETEATFKAGIFTVTFTAADGSRMILTGQLDGKDRLVGPFGITVWGFIKDGITGEWELERVE
ncbi:MAG: zinc ribbon domain-containing protein [Anaerolineae bacterium]|nr:zinc ribbon domain-containing protein [Anaerolineae bacterium]